ncbi:MAG: sugar transferase [Balneolaceae bacterium]
MNQPVNTISVRERIFKEVHIERRLKNSSQIYLPSQFMEMAHRQYSAKRLFDVLLASVALLFFSLLFPFIAAGIKISSRGPIIFKQKRTGLNGHPFICYKFRTMSQVTKKQQNGKPDITYKGDMRVYRFGQFLRRSNLDELPQIINVLKGDMSIVGPRPYPVQECAHWNTIFDDFYYRYAVKPGITGYAQVKGYRGGTLDEALMRKRTDLDLIYTQKKSLLLDMKVVAATALQMIRFDTNGH